MGLPSMKIILTAAVLQEQYKELENFTLVTELKTNISFTCLNCNRLKLEKKWNDFGGLGSTDHHCPKLFSKRPCRK